MGTWRPAWKVRPRFAGRDLSAPFPSSPGRAENPAVLNGAEPAPVPAPAELSVFVLVFAVSAERSCLSPW